MGHPFSVGRYSQDPSYQSLPLLGELIREKWRVMGRTVIIGTGFRSDIGKALLNRWGSEADVLVMGRTPMVGPGVSFLEADLRRSPECWRPALTQWLHDTEASVAGMVHLAGLVYSDRLEGTTLDEWYSMMDVNLTAAWALGQTLSPWFTESSSVVLVGSVDARYASEEGPAAAYGASKAGLYGLMRHWAAEWGARGIRVNGVAPGALAVGMGVQDTESQRAVSSHVALGRLGQADEVAAVIAFLLSPEASYISGAWIPVDGGLNLRY